MEEGEIEEDPAAPLLRLFDLNWFHHLILHSSRHIPPPSSPSPTSLPLFSETEVAESEGPPPIADLQPPLPPHRNNHCRSFSDDFAQPPETYNLRLPKLTTILSGKAGEAETEIPTSDAGGSWRKGGRRRRRRTLRSESRSMTELEFEELKGFMELGFDFSEVKTDDRLMSIVPGLQRLKASGGEDSAPGSPLASKGDGEESVVMRPYLSEAWEAAMAAEEEERLRRWRIPAAGEGIDLKDHLRLWAQRVASTVQ